MSLSLFIEKFTRQMSLACSESHVIRFELQLFCLIHTLDYAQFTRCSPPCYYLRTSCFEIFPFWSSIKSSIKVMIDLINSGGGGGGHICFSDQRGVPKKSNPLVPKFPCDFFRPLPLPHSLAWTFQQVSSGLMLPFRESTTTLLMIIGAIFLSLSLSVTMIGRISRTTESLPVVVRYWSKSLQIETHTTNTL